MSLIRLWCIRSAKNFESNACHTLLLLLLADVVLLITITVVIVYTSTWDMWLLVSIASVTAFEILLVLILGCIYSSTSWIWFPMKLTIYLIRICLLSVSCTINCHRSVELVLAVLITAVQFVSLLFVCVAKWILRSTKYDEVPPSC
jgi:hypothetical protein